VCKQFPGKVNQVCDSNKTVTHEDTTSLLSTIIRVYKARRQK